jgi:hypothetical protein
MSRRGTILLLTHGYPLFIAGHLYFGDWCRRCQVLFNIVPIIVFGGLFYTWLSSSNVKLEKVEQLFLRYFICNLVFIYCYYVLCLFSKTKWIYDHNWQVCFFLLVTLIFYGLNYANKRLLSLGDNFN